MLQPIVKAEQLTKRYGGLLALDRMTFSIPRGRIVGLLGPNGSGKTTLIKILAGLLTTTEGSIRIDGMLPGEKTSAIVSYLPERTYFNSWMRVSECLSYFSDFYADFDRKRAEAMLEDLGVSLDAKLRTLSKGTKEKVQLVLVMARRALLYLLDEPIAGVDPAAREYIIKTVIENYDPQATVLISTHLIADIEPVLNEYLFIHRGRIVSAGDVKRVTEEHGCSLDAYFREVFRCL